MIGSEHTTSPFKISNILLSGHSDIPQTLISLYHVKFFEIFNQKFTIMMASIHKDEEWGLLNFVKNLINKYPKIQFYIAPRHINRANKIKKNFDNKNISSCLEDQGKDKKIIIINSFGNLPKICRPVLI